MKMNFSFLFALLSIVFVSVSCQSLGQALSKDSATISGQFSDLKNAFDSGMSGMSTQIKDAVSSAQNQLQNFFSGNTTQATGAKDALSNLAFWNNDVTSKLRTSAQKLLDYKGVDGKFDAPKAEIANYMVNAKSQPNITDMINLARKHLSSEDASKFFDQMASVAEQQKW
uniref:Uncharacterized protein n=1 Tax=Panagrolaimus superbus TaxID=310955 RepID=A0A914Z8Y6_9BILA